MNITIEALSKSIIKQILSDIGQMESRGDVKFSLTKSQKWGVASKWNSMIKDMITEAIVTDKPYTAGFDGSAKPNPGLMTIGGWIRDPNGNLVFSFTEIHGQGTNNEAEYKALIRIFEEIKKRGIQKIDIKGDSALVVNQIKGEWKTKDPRMEKLKNEVYSIAREAGVRYNIEHVVRKYNSEADSLTR